MDSGLFCSRSFDDGEAHLPPGFRFHPTDEELIIFYLLKKVLDGCFTARAIAEVDLNKCEPWELPGKATMGENEWYFFSLRDRKYPTGLRTNRATGGGYWKATGKDREIISTKTAALVGMKKTLVFYKGRAPKGEKSNWVMHEYRLEGKFAYHFISRSSKDEWVISRVFQKSALVGGSKKSRCGAAIITGLEALSPYCGSLQSPLIRSWTLPGDHCDGPKESNQFEHVSCFSTIETATDAADCNYEDMSILSSLTSPGVGGNGLLGTFVMSGDVSTGLCAQQVPSATPFRGAAAISTPWHDGKGAMEFDCMWS